MTALLTAREALAEEWRTSSPKTAEDVATFYLNAEGIADDLDAWHETPERKEWTAAVIAAATVAKAQRVIDVGAGAGHDLIALREAFPDIQIGAVEPNHKLRERLSEQGIESWPKLDLVPSTLRDLDMIVCLDVLEHVTDPEALLGQIIDRLKMGGVFVEATATHDIATPLHLSSLRGWSPARLLDRHGFVCRENVGRCRVWQRTRENRADQNTLLLCAWRDINSDTVICMTDLIKKGWRYQLHRGDALISRVRSIAVSKWLRESDGDVFLMIDSDITFTANDAEKVVNLAREKKSIACAAYPVRGGSHLACRQVDGATITFGPEAPPKKIAYAGTGFMAAHRDVCEAVAATMPLCHADQDWAMWPMFMPMIAQSPFDPKTGDPLHEYLSEDWAFCERAKQLGYDTWLDPSVIITHLGNAPFDIYNMNGVEPVEATDVTGAVDG